MRNIDVFAVSHHELVVEETVEFPLLPWCPCGDILMVWMDPIYYCKISNIRHTNPITEMIVVSSCSCPWPIHWSQVLSWEWRCSWSSADRRYSNYIWVIDNFIANLGATYIRGLPVASVVYNWLRLCCVGNIYSLQWRHNERDCVLNLHRLDCLPNRLFGRRSKKT